MQIAELLADGVDLAEDEQIRALVELTEKTVHKDYRLIKVLRRGVGFHYGNMPTLVRAEIERLFGDGTLRYLVCTSTLLEGVNLPCRNLFVRGPKRGSDRPMSLSDFWNLAGRAGRWGKEFRGNIMCVDTLAGGWDAVPDRRVHQTLRRSSDDILSRIEGLRAFIESPNPASVAHDEPVTASVFSLLATRVSQGHPLLSIPGVTMSDRDARDLEQRIARVLEAVEVPAALMSRHAGISPTAMQVLLDYFRGHEPDTLPLRSPESPRSDLSYTKALSRCRDYLGSPYFGSDKRCAMLGFLLRDWMQGRPDASAHHRAHGLPAQKASAEQVRPSKDHPRDDGRRRADRTFRGTEVPGLLPGRPRPPPREGRREAGDPDGHPDDDARARRLKRHGGVADEPRHLPCRRGRRGGADNGRRPGQSARPGVAERSEPRTVGCAGPRAE